MDELVQFLRARLDEDERIAKAATPGPWLVNDESFIETIYARDGHTAVVAGGRWGGEAPVFESDEDATHIARHDPARVLAEVEAKRRLLLWAESAECGMHLVPIVDNLVGVYRDHPDFDPAWMED